MCKEADSQAKIIFLKRNLQRIRVDEISGCWLWTGAINPNGYGKVNLKGVDHGAHRAFYKVFKGEIPQGLFVCHKCDVPNCVNPDHLKLGTPKENMADMFSKNRQPDMYKICRKGEDVSSAKLTNEKVLDIRNRHAAGESMRSLGRRYGVSHRTVGYIINRKMWKHI